MKPKVVSDNLQGTPPGPGKGGLCRAQIEIVAQRQRAYRKKLFRRMLVCVFASVLLVLLCALVFGGTSALIASAQFIAVICFALAVASVPILVFYGLLIG